jgi:hypothetical protein
VKTDLYEQDEFLCSLGYLLKNLAWTMQKMQVDDWRIIKLAVFNRQRVLLIDTLTDFC